MLDAIFPPLHTLAHTHSCCTHVGIHTVLLHTSQNVAIEVKINGKWLHVAYKLHFIRVMNNNIFQEYDNGAEALVSSLFVNSLEDEDYDVGECHCNLHSLAVIINVGS
jgi:hypothetical protein